MRYRVRLSAQAVEDLARLTEHLVVHESARDPERRLRDAIEVLERLPFVGRPARTVEGLNLTLRELVVPSGDTGYALLYRVGPGRLVSILAARHQREEQYH